MFRFPAPVLARDEAHPRPDFTNQTGEQLMSVTWWFGKITSSCRVARAAVRSSTGIDNALQRFGGREISITVPFRDVIHGLELCWGIREYKSLGRSP